MGALIWYLAGAISGIIACFIWALLAAAAADADVMDKLR